VSRRTELLLAATEALAEGTDPFHESFLVDHGVTLDECYDLSEQLALGARALVVMGEQRQYTPVLGLVLAEVVTRWPE